MTWEKQRDRPSTGYAISYEKKIGNDPIVIKHNPQKRVVLDCGILRNINKYDCFWFSCNEKRVCFLFHSLTDSLCLWHFKLVWSKCENCELKFDDVGWGNMEWIHSGRECEREEEWLFEQIFVRRPLENKWHDVR